MSNWKRSINQSCERAITCGSGELFSSRAAIIMSDMNTCFSVFAINIAVVTMSHFWAIKEKTFFLLFFLPATLLRNANKRRVNHAGIRPDESSTLHILGLLIRGHCGDEYFMRSQRGKKAITSQSYGFSPFAVSFFLFRFSFAAAPFTKQGEKSNFSPTRRGAKIKIEFSYATAEP